MRKILGIVVLAICAVALAAGGRAFSQPGKVAPAGDAVKGEGCLRAGTEAGCKILTTADKKKYSLHFGTGDNPTTGVMISFEGTAVDVDTCMQGTPVKVTKWTPLKTKCPAETK